MQTTDCSGPDPDGFVLLIQGRVETPALKGLNWKIPEFSRGLDGGLSELF